MPASVLTMTPGAPQCVSACVLSAMPRRVTGTWRMKVSTPVIFMSVDPVRGDQRADFGGGLRAVIGENAQAPGQDLGRCQADFAMSGGVIHMAAVVPGEPRARLCGGLDDEAGLRFAQCPSLDVKPGRGLIEDRRFAGGARCDADDATELCLPVRRHAHTQPRLLGLTDGRRLVRMTEYRLPLDDSGTPTRTEANLTPFTQELLVQRGYPAR